MNDMENIRRSILEDILNDQFKGNKSAMARGLGMKLPNVSGWFTGQRAVTDKALTQVCDTLELNYSELLKSKLE